MKKVFLWLLIISIIAVFSLAGCNVEETEEVTVDKSVEESEPDIAFKIVELAKSQIGKLTGDGPFASLIWSDSEITYCDRFVSAVMTVASGESLFERKSYPTAYDDYIAHKDLIKFGEPPKGAVVYYGKHEENLNCGHVGISDGEGNVISVVNKTKGVDITPRNYFRAPLLGWVTFKEYKGQEGLIEEATTKGKIAFESDRDGNDEIYIMNIDGSDQVNLTNNPADDYGPCFSPDGKKITFSSNRDGNGQIYVMDADGTEQTNLSNNNFNDSGPSWSPDGKKIIFISKRDRDLDFQIYVMDADGTNQTNLSNNSYHESVASWSPDGKKITFISDSSGNFQIYVMDVDGTNRTNLSNNNFYDGGPSWSPDGKKITFFSDRSGDFQIYVMDVDGTNQTNLSNSNFYGVYPLWSPDGKKIAFTSFRDGNNQIYVVNSDGTEMANLSNNRFNDYYSAWSPFL